MKVILSCSLGLWLSLAVHAGADPTRPELLAAVKVSATTEPVVAAAPLKLSLIRNVQGSYLALVNGKTLRQGDSIEGYKVQSINNQQVVLQKQNERLTLSVFKAMKSQ